MSQVEKSSSDRPEIQVPKTDKLLADLESQRPKTETTQRELREQLRVNQKTLDIEFSI